MMTNFEFCCNAFKNCLLEMHQNVSEKGKGLIIYKRYYQNNKLTDSNFITTSIFRINDGKINTFFTFYMQQF